MHNFLVNTHISAPVPLYKNLMNTLLSDKNFQKQSIFFMNSNNKLIVNGYDVMNEHGKYFTWFILWYYIYKHPGVTPNEIYEDIPEYFANAHDVRIECEGNIKYNMLNAGTAPSTNALILLQ